MSVGTGAIARAGAVPASGPSLPRTKPGRADATGPGSAGSVGALSSVSRNGTTTAELLDRPWFPFAAILALFAVTSAAGILEIAPRVPRELIGARVLTPAVIGLLVWIPLLHVTLRFAARFPLAKATWRRNLPKHVGMALAVHTCHIVLFQTACEPFRQPARDLPGVLIGIGRSLRYNLNGNLTSYGVIVGVAAAIDLMRRFRRREINARRLEQEVDDLKLDALAVQLQPHFVFSTLNTVLPLIYSSPQLATETIIRLGALLRLSFRDEPFQLVPLRKEVELLESYLAIEKTRLQDRLDFGFGVPAALNEAAIPSFLLQPLVADAIRAVVFPNPGPFRIDVVGREDAGLLEIAVRVSGALDEAIEPVPEPPVMRGLRNRLRERFESRATLTVRQSAPDGLETLLRIPLVAKDNGVKEPKSTLELPIELDIPQATGPTVEGHALHREPDIDGVSGVFRASRKKPARRAALFVGFWLLVALYSASESLMRFSLMIHRPSLTFWEIVRPSFLRALDWTILTPLILALYRRFPLQKGRLAPRLLVHALFGFAISSVVVAAGLAWSVVFPVWRPLTWMGYPIALAKLMPSELISEVFTYALFVGILWVVDRQALLRSQELLVSELSGQLSRARLATLKRQIEPHFLYNTLNTMLPLVFTDPDAAARTVVRLGELLRLSLRRHPSHLIPLRAELDFVRRYLEIEETRFKDRLTVRVDAPADVLSAEVPNLLLQPLVENAVRHGISRHPGPGAIEISARAEGALLKLRVWNTWAGIRGVPTFPPARPGKGIGLANTKERLRHAYGTRCRLDIVEGQGGFEVSIEVPLSRRSAAADPEEEVASALDPYASVAV